MKAASRFLVGVAVGAGSIALVMAFLVLSGRSSDTVSGLRAPSDSLVGPDDSAGDGPAFERVLPPASTQEPEEVARPRPAVRSLGRLSEGELAVVIEDWEKVLERLRAELAEGEAPSDPLEKELHEAQLLWRIGKRMEAIAMLRRGDYATFDGSAPARPSDCEPITRSWAGSIDGKSVGLAVYVPIESKSLEGATIRYRNAYDAYWRSRAGRFNALPEEERRSRIEAHDRLAARLMQLEEAKKSPEALAEMKQIRSELLTQGPLYLERGSSSLAFP